MGVVGSEPSYFLSSASVKSMGAAVNSFQNLVILVEGSPPQKKLSRVTNQLSRHDENVRNVITRATSTSMEKELLCGVGGAFSCSVVSFAPFRWRTTDMV